MYLFAKCPNCGGVEWECVDEENAFACKSCFETFFPEEMSLCSGIDLTKVWWHKDGVTDRYVERNSNILHVPSSMTPQQLVKAIKHCETIENPFAQELTAKAGMEDDFLKAASLEKKSAIVLKAAKVFEIWVI